MNLRAIINDGVKNSQSVSHIIMSALSLTSCRVNVMSDIPVASLLTAPRHQFPLAPPSYFYSDQQQQSPVSLPKRTPFSCIVTMSGQ